MEIWTRHWNYTAYGPKQITDTRNNDRLRYITDTEVTLQQSESIPTWQINLSGVLKDIYTWTINGWWSSQVQHSSSQIFKLQIFIFIKTNPNKTQLRLLLNHIV